MFIKWIRFFFEEAKFLKSFDDIKIFINQKLPFLLPRVFSKKRFNAKVPLSLQLEPTNYCNVNCICCPTDKMKRGKGHMNIGLFKKIIDEASAIGVKRVHLYLHGESMIHPRIDEMIQYIKVNRLGISMHTNGMLFSREKIENILYSGVNSGDYFLFSILGYSKEVHERIMKKVNHEKVIKNILDFIQLRKQLKINGPIIEVIFYRLSENINEEAEFVSYWRKIVDHVHPVGDISKSFAGYKVENKTIPLRSKTCKLLWERMTIFWNGDVTMCAEDLDGDHVLGNLREKTIRDIWNGDKMLAIKNLHRDKLFKNISLCSRCDQ